MSPASGTSVDPSLPGSNKPGQPATQAPQTTPDIIVDSVSKQYEGRTILDNVSVTIPSGQTVALIGPSGGGKSTLLRCLNGLCAFDTGSISMGGFRLGPSSPSISSRDASPESRSTRDLPAVRRMLGMVFQDFQLFPHLTALENIIEAPIRVLGKPKKEAADEAAVLLQRVGLGDRAGFYPRQLSGGQKQRVAIARALAMKPRGLLCDEITSALDPELKNEVLGVLEGLKRDGLTLIVVTHEIGFARRAADRVLFLADGRIVEDGPPHEVIDRPATPRAKNFLSRLLG